MRLHRASKFVSGGGGSLKRLLLLQPSYETYFECKFLDSFIYIGSSRLSVVRARKFTSHWVHKCLKLALTQCKVKSHFRRVGTITESLFLFDHAGPSVRPSVCPHARV